MLKLKKGCSVPFPEKLFEQYEMGQNRLIANVGVDKTKAVLEHFISMHDEPLFFILELPARRDEQTGTHLLKNVYYLDGCSQEKALDVLSRTGELLIQDGLNSFGFGGHESKDEILVGKYNVVTLYSRTIKKYEGFFEVHEIHRTDHLVTAWNTFSKQHPGEAVRYIHNGKDVFSIPDELKTLGMYFAEQREE